MRVPHQKFQVPQNAVSYCLQLKNVNHTLISFDISFFTN